MSYTHNMEAQYRDVALQAREEVSEGRKEFYKLFGATGFSVLAAAACGGGSSVSAPATPAGGETSGLVTKDYEAILAGNARGWKYLSSFHEDYAYMNYGTTGSMPTSVLQDLAYWHRDVAYSPAGPLSWQVSNAVIRADQSKAIYGCLPQEMICSFNTTDGMIKTICGIKWTAGDYVIMTNNEHAGGLGPIHMCANRYGLNMVEVNVPTGSVRGAGSGGYTEGTPGQTDGEMIQRFDAARASIVAKGGKVRAIMFSSPCYTLGWRLEEAEICKWAWGYNILTIVDGAHIPGSMPIDLHAMGCDYFAGTAAKWQCGPGQTGYAYVRMGKKGDATKTTSFQNRTVATADWSNPNGMEPFYIMSSSGSSWLSPINYPAGDTTKGNGWCGIWNLPGNDLGGAVAGVGNPNYPTLKIIYEVNKVWDGIGRQAIAKYNQSLAQYLRQMCATSDKMGQWSLGTDFQTPANVVPTGKADEVNFPRYLQTGLTAVNPFGPNKDFNDVLDATQSTIQASASSAVLSRIMNEYGIVIRNISTKHQLRSNPGASAIANLPSGQPCDPAFKTNSSPLRISTHLYTTVDEVKRLVAGLNNVL